MIRSLIWIMIALAPHAAAAKEIMVPATMGALKALIVAGTVAAGDSLVLARGDHGALGLQGTVFDPPVTVRAATGASVSRLSLRDSAGWRFVGLRVVADEESDQPLVSIRDSRDIAIEDFDISSGESVERWSKATWLNRMRNGIQASGTRLRIENNRLKGVYHGIVVIGDGVLVDGNTITWFAGDGIRALADNAVYRGNTIDTCVEIDDNHDDGIQSWSLGENGRAGEGVVRNVRIEANVIRNGSAGRLTCGLQGIGFFDGIFENLVIRRNVVIVNHWHGITVMGGRNVTISENLVVDAEPGQDGVPWIAITAHKDGRLSRNGLIAENITEAWSGGANSPFGQPQPGVRLENNRTVPSPRAGIELWNRENR